MPDMADYIRDRLKQAREDAGLSQYDLAKKYHSAQGTISGIERGRVQVTAVGLARLATIMRRPITYFFPDADLSGLTDEEQRLVNDFRHLPQEWRDAALEYVRTLVDLHAHVTAEEQARTDAMLVDRFWDIREQQEQELVECYDHIVDEFEQGNIVFLSPVKQRVFGRPLAAETVIDAVEGHYAGTKQEAALRSAREKRLLELWREDRLELRGPEQGVYAFYELDSEENVVMAWELGRLQLVDE